MKLCKLMKLLKAANCLFIEDEDDDDLPEDDVEVLFVDNTTATGSAVCQSPINDVTFNLDTNVIELRR